MHCDKSFPFSFDAKLDVGTAITLGDDGCKFQLQQQLRPPHLYYIDRRAGAHADCRAARGYPQAKWPTPTRLHAGARPPALGLALAASIMRQNDVKCYWYVFGLRLLKEALKTFRLAS